MIFRKNIILLFFLFLGSLGYLLTFYNYGINWYDEGVSPGMAIRILQGEMGGRDFVLGPIIGVHILYALLFKLFGPHLNAIRLTMALFTAFTIILAYLVSRRIMPPLFALLMTALLLIAPGPYYARFFIILTFLNLLIIIKYLERQNLLWVVTAGTVAGLSFVFRVDVGVITAITTCIVIIARNIFYRDFSVSKKEAIKITINKIAVYSLAATVIIAPIFVSYFLPAFYNNLFFIPSLSAFGRWSLPFPKLAFFIKDWKDIENIRFLFESLLFYLIPLIYLVVLFLIIRHFSSKKTHKVDLYLMLFLIFGSLAFYRVILRPDFEHLLHVAPCAYILGCYLLFRLWQKGRNLISPKRRARLVPSLLSNAFILIVILAVPFIFIMDVILYHGFQTGSIGVLKGRHSLLNIPQAKIYCLPHKAEIITRIVNYIKTHTDSEDKIYALPFNPIWYFFCNRNSPLPSFMLTPHAGADDNRQRKIIKAIDRNQVKYIIYNDWLADGCEDRRFRYYAKLVESYIRNNYHFEKKIGDFDLLRRNEITDPYPFIIAKTEDSFDFIVNLSKAKIKTANSDDVRVERFYIEGEGREVIFAHPPAEITYRLNIPPRAWLKFGVGIKPQAWSRNEDGVLFEIYIFDAQSQKHKLFSKYINPKNKIADREWHDIKLDLSKYSAQEVVLSLVTSFGPANNGDYDWAGWSEPEVVWRQRLN